MNDDMDFDNDFDGGDDFDSGSDDKVENITDRGNSQIDAIAELLSTGDSTKADAIAEKGGRSSKAIGGSYDVDSHGNMDFGGNDKPSQASTEQVQEYGISGYQTTEAINHHQAEVDQAHAAYEKLQQMHQAGELDDMQFQHYSNMAGMHAGQHQRALLENQLAQRDHADQQRQAYDYLEKEFPGQFADPEVRRETLSSVVDWMIGPDIGLDPDYLRDVEDPNIIKVALRSMNAIQKEQEQRDTIAAQAAQIRRLKQARGQGRKQGRRSAEVGNRSGQEAVIDEVAAILSGETGKGGRR